MNGSIRRIHLCAPVSRQIAPVRVHGFDERNLFASEPALDLFLASDGMQRAGEFLKVHLACAVILRGESGDEVLLVLIDAPVKTIRHTGVERPALARQDINPEPLAHGRMRARAETTGKQNVRVGSSRLKSSGQHC